jgi:hypothetical protein
MPIGLTEETSAAIGANVNDRTLLNVVEYDLG